MYTEHDAYAKEMAAVFSGVRQRDPSEWMNWYDWILPVDISPAFRNAVEDASQRWKGRPYVGFVAKMGRLKLPLASNFDVRVADKTIERIRSIHKRSFMITCSFNAPHDPNVVPSPYYEMFDPSSIKLPDNLEYRESRFENSWSRQMVAGFGEDGLREFLRVYYASVKMIDDQIGRIIQALEETEQLDNTLVVFTADHGDMAGGHGMAWKSNGSFYDEVVQVPLIMRYPEKFRRQRCHLAVDLTDLMPTLLAVTGHAIPEQVQGQNLVPFVTGQRDAATARSYSFAERVGAAPGHVRQLPKSTSGSFMVRGQGWKYIRFANAEEYLYHLAEDPGETRNVAQEPDVQDIKKKMTLALESWQIRTGWRE
jgi:arylsulfatase A-like enzyme